MKDIGTAPLKQYKFANTEFSKFANIYRGKNGLFNQIEKARSTTSQKYLDDFVKDKREHWRANSAKASQRQRRYEKRLTKQILLLKDMND